MVVKSYPTYASSSNSFAPHDEMLSRSIQASYREARIFGSVSLHIVMPVPNQLRATVMFAEKFRNVRFTAKISYCFYYNVPNVPNVR